MFGSVREGCISFNQRMGLKEELMDFIVNPPPPSEVHRVGVTAVGLGASRVAGVPPIYAAVAGAAAVIGGHYGLRAWWVKSLGYGLLADAAVGAAQSAFRKESAAPMPSLPANGIQSPPAAPEPPDSQIIKEADLLMLLENGDIFLSVTAPSGSAIRAATLQPYVRIEISNRVVPIGEYVSLFAMKVREAEARGRSRRNRRAHPNLQHQTEGEYLQWVKDVCLIDNDAPSLASDPDAKRFETAEARRSRDILLPDGTYRSPEIYAREFAAEIRRIFDECSSRVRDARDNGNLPSRDATTPVSQPTQPTVVLTDIRATPATVTTPQATASQVATAVAEVVRPNQVVANQTIIGKLTGPSGAAATVTPIRSQAKSGAAKRGGNPRSR